MAAYSTPLDIANRACQWLEQPRITSFTDTSSRAAAELAFSYDKIRSAELERNTWIFATRRVVLRAIGVDTLLWTPPTWSSSGSYATSIVTAYKPTSGIYAGQTDYWQIDGNGVPGDVPGTATTWHRYTGPVAADLYDGKQTYAAGELVIVPAQWNSGTTYAKNAVVNGTSGNDGTWYVSLANGNLNNAVTDTAHWAVWASNGRSTTGWGETAGGTLVPLTYPGTPLFYLSLSSDNADNPRSSGAQWLSVNGTGQSLRPVYPVGTGPSAQTSTLNVFYLPHAFLRELPAAAKSGLNAFLGVGGPFATDYIYEGGAFLVSSSPHPILLRFVADVVDVPDMHALFCEALALKDAASLFGVITQSAEKRAQIRAEYPTIIGEARLVNAIEAGWQDPPEDEFVTVRR